MNYIYNTYNAYNPVLERQYIFNNEKRLLRKTSNGVGFFIFTYTVVMQVAALGLIMLMRFMKINVYNANNQNVLFLLEIFASVFSAFIPGLFYLILSQKKPSQVFPAGRVKLNKLIPLIMIGMGITLIANIAANALGENLKIIGLQNSTGSSTTVHNATEFILYIVSTAIVPAFAEEFAFRGIVLGALRKYGDLFAVLASSIMFGAMHANISQIPFAFILGLIFGYIVCKTNSIIPSILIHFANNFYAVIKDTVMNSTDLPNYYFYIFYYTTTILFVVLALLSFIYIIKTDKNFFKSSDKSSTPEGNTQIFTLSDKMQAFFLNAGVITSLVIFLGETILQTQFIYA